MSEPRREWARWRIGRRVVIVGAHAWSGYEGEIVRYEEAPGLLGALYGECPVVRLDRGPCVGVFEARQLRHGGWLAGRLAGTPEAAPSRRELWPGPDWRHAWEG